MAADTRFAGGTAQSIFEINMVRASVLTIWEGYVQQKDLAWDWNYVYGIYII